MDNNIGRSERNPGQIPEALPPLRPLSRYDIAARLLIDDIHVVLALGPKQVEALVRELQEGCHVTKFGRSGKAARRWLTVTPDREAVQYMSRRKAAKDCTFPFKSIDRVQRGQGTSVFSRVPKPWRDGQSASACLSIVAAGGRSLDVAFDSPAKAETWALGLAALLLRHRVSLESSDDRQLRRAFVTESSLECPEEWEVASVGSHSTLGQAQHKGSLSLARAAGLLARLNIGPVSPASTGAGSDGSWAWLMPLAAAAVQKVTQGQDLSSAGEAGPSRMPAAPGPDLRLTLPAFLALVDALRCRPDVEALYLGLQDWARDDSSATEDEGQLVRQGVLPVRHFAAFVSGSPSSPVCPAGVGGQGEAELGHGGNSSGSTDGASPPALSDSVVRLASYLDPGRWGKGVSLPSFVSWLTSPLNSTFDPGCAVLHQPMSLPLACYFIDSSHNTYLEAGQVTGGASVAPYLSVVQRGVRCVELDLWDGPGQPGNNGQGSPGKHSAQTTPAPPRPGSATRTGAGTGSLGSIPTAPVPALAPTTPGEPVVTHGHTLTGRVPLSRVLAALAAHGFTTSPYPLILSLEVHANPGQQDVAARLLEDTFGPRLVRPGDFPCPGEDPWAALPSPGALQGRVLVKAKLKKDMGPEGKAKAKGGTEGPVLPTGPLPARLLSPSSAISPVLSGASGTAGSVGSSTEAGSSPYRGSTAGPAWDVPALPDHDPGRLLSSRLASLVFLPTVKLHKLPTALPARAMASVKESKVERLLSLPGGPEAMVAATAQCPVRVYPGPLRIDSSNYGPGPYWTVGVQCCALNYQTVDMPTRLARAWFRQNGRTGYVLKPRYLREGRWPHDGAGGEAGATGTLSTTLSSALASPGGQATADAVTHTTVVSVTPGRALVPGMSEHGASDAPAVSDRPGLEEPNTSSRRPPALPASLLAVRAFGRASSPTSPVRRHLRLRQDEQDGPASARVRTSREGEREGSTTSAGPQGRASGADWPDASIQQGDGQASARPADAAAATGQDSHGAGPAPEAAPPKRPTQPSTAPGPSMSLLLSPLWGGDESCVTLAVTVMGAQHLPKRQDGPDLPCPFVSLLVYGDTGDTTRARSSVAFPSSPRPPCSPYWSWGETFLFRVARPATSILYLALHDASDAREGLDEAGMVRKASGKGLLSGSAATPIFYSTAGPAAQYGPVGPCRVPPGTALKGATGFTGRSSFVAYFAVPLPALRLGYRSCQLRNAYGKKLPLCTMMVRLQRLSGQGTSASDAR